MKIPGAITANKRNNQRGSWQRSDFSFFIGGAIRTGSGAAPFPPPAEKLAQGGANTGQGPVPYSAGGFKKLGGAILAGEKGKKQDRQPGAGVKNPKTAWKNQNPDYYPQNPAQQQATGTRCSWCQVNRQRSGRAAAAAGRKQAGAQLAPRINPGGAADTRRSAGGLSFLQVDRGRSGRQLVPGAIRNRQRAFLLIGTRRAGDPGGRAAGTRCS